MTYHPVVNAITALLTEKGLAYETFEHEPVRTSEEAARVRPGFSLKQGAKAIIVRYRKNSGPAFAMFVLPGDRKFDGKKAKEILDTKNLTFATEEEVEKITGGVKVGGVPPFGNLFDLPVFADRSLFENEKIIFNAGDRRFSIAIKSADYKEIVNPVILDIAFLNNRHTPQDGV